MAATINATLKSATANSFVTLAEANTYFETVPDSSTWDDKTDDQKNRALISATRWIDTLNFYGDRCMEVKYNTSSQATGTVNNVFDVYPWLQSYLGAYCLGGSGSYSVRVVRG